MADYVETLTKKNRAMFDLMKAEAAFKKVFQDLLLKALDVRVAAEAAATLERDLMESHTDAGRLFDAGISCDSCKSLIDLFDKYKKVLEFYKEMCPKSA